MLVSPVHSFQGSTKKLNVVCCMYFSMVYLVAFYLILLSGEF